MRPHLAVTALLAACLVSGAALAANDRVESTFESFAASGVTGEASINPMPDGNTQIHAALRGLEPSTEYVALVYTASQSCADGTSSLRIVEFESNPAGVVTWNDKVAEPLASLRSIGIRKVEGNTLVACASIAP